MKKFSLITVLFLLFLKPLFALTYSSDPQAFITELVNDAIEKLANKDLTKIETPEYPDRKQWVHDLGYKLWSEKEIRDGTVFKRFKSKLGL